MQGASPDLLNLPFSPVSSFYKEKFGEKVFKIPVALAGRCPNMKDGSGLKTCIFCDEWGSFAYPKSQQKDLRQQIDIHRARVKKRYNSKKFFIYFQAYTTSYTGVQRIREAFTIAQEYDDVVGIIIGTRPDCLSPALLDLFNETAEKTFMAVELGVQSFDEKQLKWMRRGHTAEQSLGAIRRIKKNCPKVDLGIHLMFGWPNENLEDVKRCAEICNENDIDNVKLHNLHVLKNTDLENLFKDQQFDPVDRETYSEMVAYFLAHLRSSIKVHRLAATASRWDELISPEWTRHKMANYQYVVSYMKNKNITQGCYL